MTRDSRGHWRDEPDNYGKPSARGQPAIYLAAHVPGWRADGPDGTEKDRKTEREIQEQEGGGRRALMVECEIARNKKILAPVEPC